MPKLTVLPQVGTLLALLTKTSTGTSANATLPLSASYRLFLQVQTVTGTSPTLDVWLATAFDATAAAGTNYQTFLKFAQVTTSGIGRQIVFRPYLGSGDVCTESQSALFATADGTTGSGTILLNGPINPAAIEVRYVIGGTSPQFAFAVGYIANPQDLSGY